jgi:hypothetical protein
MKKLLAAGIAAFILLCLLTACRELEDIPLNIWSGSEWEYQDDTAYTIKLGNDSLSYKDNNNLDKSIRGLRLGSLNDPDAETAVENSLPDPQPSYKIDDWVYQGDKLLFFMFSPVNRDSKARERLQIYDPELRLDMQIDDINLSRTFIICLEEE